MQFKLLAHLLSFTLFSSVVCQGVATNGTKSDQGMSDVLSYIFNIWCCFDVESNNFARKAAPF